MSFRRQVNYDRHDDHDYSDSINESTDVTTFGPSISSTRTESNQVGPGRVMGNWISAAGRGLEKTMGRLALRARVGPVVRVEQRISSFSKTLFLSEPEREEVCSTLLELAADRIPSVQLLAFKKIIDLIIEDPSLARCLQDTFHQHSKGELMEDGVRSWQRGGKIYDTEWIRVYRQTRACLTRDLDQVPDAVNRIQKRLKEIKDLILAEQLDDLGQCSTLVSCAESSSPGVQLFAFRCIAELQMERATDGLKRVLQQFCELRGISIATFTLSWRRDSTIYSRQWFFLYGLAYDSLARDNSRGLLDRYRKGVQGFAWPFPEPEGYALKRQKMKLSHLLDCAWFPDPGIQLEVFRRIVDTLTWRPSLFPIFLDCLQRHGETVDTVVATWRQSDNTSRDLVLYSNLASACVSKNDTTDIARRISRTMTNEALHNEADCDRRCHPYVTRLVECCMYNGYEGYVAMRILGAYSYNLLVHLENDRSLRTTLYSALPHLILERLGASSEASCEDLGGVCMLANSFLEIMWDDENEQITSDVRLWKTVFKIVERIRSLIFGGKEWLKDESRYALMDWKTLLQGNDRTDSDRTGITRNSRFLTEVLELAPAGLNSSSHSFVSEDEDRDDRDSLISATNTEERSDFDPITSYNRFDSDASDDRYSDGLTRDLSVNEEDY